MNISNLYRRKVNVESRHTLIHLFKNSIFAISSMRINYVIALVFLFASIHCDCAAKIRVVSQALPVSDTFTLPKKNIQLISWQNRYDSALLDSIFLIIVNDSAIKNMSPQEKAAIGFIITFIGNQCHYSNSTTDSLQCTILHALGLGYQCSNTHLGYLRHWFANDSQAIKELESCPLIPDGATVQNTIDYLHMSTLGNQITITYKIAGINLRESRTWNYTVTDMFNATERDVRLISRQKGKVRRGKLKF